MARLKGIADGLLGTFVSRNNDIGGYWALGILRLYAIRKDLSEITIDLLNVEASTALHSPISLISRKYREWLINQLNKSGIERARLTNAEIKVKFSTFVEFPDAIRETRGEPYVCTVVLTADNGVTYMRSKLSCCAPHDPIKEYRSLRTP